MRSQLLVLSMISLAVSGCGKDVEKNARPVVAGQQNPMAGGCVDPIQTNYKPISHFSDMAMAKGKYHLHSFVAVGKAVLGEGTPNPAQAISVVNAQQGFTGELIVDEVCRDLNMMPAEKIEWAASTPRSIHANTGVIEENTEFTQKVFGPGVQDEMSGAARKPENRLGQALADEVSVDQMLENKSGTMSQFYQLDPETVGVLRVKKTLVEGKNIESKIFAIYSLKVSMPAPKTDPKPNPAPAPKPDPKPAPKTDNGGQGKGGQGDGGQGKGGQGSGGQGTEGTSVPTEPTSPAPTTTAPAPSTTTTTTSPAPTASTASTIELPTLPEGVEAGKMKIDMKIKETTPEGSSKTKLREKVKVNPNTGNSKQKIDFKNKVSTPDSHSKSKLKIKVKSRE